MTICNLSPPRLRMIHDQQSLMLHWRSFSWWGMEGIAICFAYKGSQKFLDNWLHPIGGVISQDAWPKIVDAHFHHGAGRVLLSVLPIKAARKPFVTDYNLLEVWFPKTHDQKSLTLRWRSFCHRCIHNIQSFNLAQSIIHIVLAAFLAFSFTFFLITTLFFNNT